MKTVTSTTLTATLLVSALAVPAVNAQETAGTPVPPALASPAVEVTPFVAMDSRGSVPIGVAVTVPLNASVSIESEVGYRRAEGGLHALSSSANLLYALPRIGRTTPYLATGAGLAQYGTPIVARDGSLIGTQPRLGFEVNAGGGLKVPVSDTVDMRTDARWFKSFGRHGSEHFRVSHGVSFDTGKR